MIRKIVPWGRGISAGVAVPEPIEKGGDQVHGRDSTAISDLATSCSLRGHCRNYHCSRMSPQSGDCVIHFISTACFLATSAGGATCVVRGPSGSYEAEAAPPYSVFASAVDQKFTETFQLDAQFTK
jgi:hypothetical protein